jgi:hypothetical protein
MFLGLIDQTARAAPTRHRPAGRGPPR